MPVKSTQQMIDDLGPRVISSVQRALDDGRKEVAVDRYWEIKMLLIGYAEEDLQVLEAAAGIELPAPPE
jgi:hypothetical protein